MLEAKDIEHAQRPMGTVTNVTKLDVYKGDSLEEKIDHFISEHPVVMINRTWCLFSVDAKDFLVRLGVSVYSIDVDIHPQGDAIMKYLSKKLNHRTTPLIFISGDFLGGFEDVNSLYSQGHLQRDYIRHLTNAEACEKVAALSSTPPLFWFPEKVNAHAIRATGVLTCFISLVSAVSAHVVEWGAYIAYFLLLDFLLRLLTGARGSPLARMGSILVSGYEPKTRLGRPKQFAALCGLTFSLLGSIFYFAVFPGHVYIGSAFIGMLAIATGMEGFLDFCLGCVFFRLGIQLGIIPK